MLLVRCKTRREKLLRKSPRLKVCLAAQSEYLAAGVEVSALKNQPAAPPTVWLVYAAAGSGEMRMMRDIKKVVKYLVSMGYKQSKLCKSEFVMW